METFKTATCISCHAADLKGHPDRRFAVSGIPIQKKRSWLLLKMAKAACRL